MQANTNATDDTIDFALPGCTSSTPCTISLTSGELLIANNSTLTITGPRRRLSVSNTTSRVFNVSPGAIVIISDLKITGGRTGNGAAGIATGGSGQDGTNGGGIYNDGGTLTLNNCNISGNVTGNGGKWAQRIRGGGIPGRGAAAKEEQQGWSLQQRRRAHFEHTTVSGNTAGNGGPGGSGQQNGRQAAMVERAPDLQS